ncbi:hypothetical protein IV203_023022 [Nitzschia inconspicua]|uniref:Coiled-coil domain-containing protein n=1 Tax=Nitzschia inconspicua TaxID=303405 RepID=A0A9K3KD93_9STRA|nr:hypothetical protein IV203_023022 [Nitzschia inconspicua]
MGRVAKYKKIKSFDPYSKQNRGSFHANGVIWGLGDNGRKAKKKSKTAEKLQARKMKRREKGKNGLNDEFDLPPSSKDEFDLADLMGSIKKEKVSVDLEAEDTKLSSTAIPTVSSSSSTSIGNVARLPKTEHDESKVAKLLKLDRQLAEKSEESPYTFERMPGESKRAYNKRTKAETRQIIHKTTIKKNVEKLQKKKEFLKQKKLLKKNKGRGGGGGGGMNDNDDDDYGDDDYPTKSSSSSEPVLITGERAIAALKEDPVQFGEQAERPPTFRQLPRGAKPKKQGGASDNTTTSTNVSSNAAAMEQLRRKVQAQYAMVRSQRRAAGERFHL